ncbi:hypothetical protein L226DRAFT_517423 [Lentinus tigrinus ALCF2SS1-7]|uniref:C3H1-type domain-containing protein n=1 Tax=Lentinus tigrinus ALCF2SS1-6 TaxID=1328759 RepID=A0A5C2RQ20_9APHY|nr:hypothetical protein L227DRAFT_604825 [Lentinus tigrinus ALCF2SS1-6]RPD68219.1 hypothetical protein L226DRAFT_517423 [Lentinus tigrinus ALCF2SS1-7]
MPAADKQRKDNDSAPDSGRDGGDRERERDKDKGPKQKSSTKTKDLSHVPCKFFKVGSCTAGSSCPFSHQVLEPGQQKEVCAWFVKGNCKFGHKCALAHVLPGQSMSMDRKNKKAAQLAANAGGGAQKDGPRSKPHKASHHGAPAGGQSRNALFSGSTAPTRSVGANARSPIPMPLKATLSPSAPAPPVKDTDFASFGLPDESNKLPSAPAQGKPSVTADSTPLEAEQPSSNPHPNTDEATPHPDRESPSPLPTHTTSAPRRISDASTAVDFGPIGSPPRASSSSSRPARINGFSPGTSPQTHPISSSPFSAPGTQTVFTISRHDDGLSDYSRSGISASLGNWGSERVMVRRIGVEEVVVEDDDLEEFIPGSLTDLLTPEERSRRMSRTNATRPHMVGMERESSQQRSEAHHRYSRSVPAPSLLQDIKSIWGADGAVPVGSPDAAGLAAGPLGGGLGNGTPSSFTSNSGLGARTVEDMLSPSNASAAFLPGLHHYINAKPQRPPMVGGLSSMYAAAAAGHNLSTSAYGHEFNGVAMSPPRTSTYGAQLPLRPAPRPIPGGEPFMPGLDDQRSAMSPSSRALQAHAPGQSLPQGLAAGYSRIHALPPPPVIPSPSSSSMLSRTPLGGGFSPGTKGLGHAHTTSGDWASMSPTAGSLLDQINNGPPLMTAGAGAPGSSLGGLETMFSRLSYSAATSRSVAAPGLGSRNPSGRGPHPQGSLSPLSGPVLTGEDDDLFSME